MNISVLNASIGTPIHTQRSVPLPQPGVPLSVNLAVQPPCGTLIHVTVGAVSGAGVAASEITHTILVDCSPPIGRHASFHSRALPPMSSTFTASGVVCVLPGTAVDASWSFDDAQTAVIQHFYAISHVPLFSVEALEPASGWDGTSWHAVGPVAFIEVDTLFAPQQSWLLVRGCNEVGLCSEIIASEAPLLIVMDPPSTDNAKLWLQELSPGILDGRDGTTGDLHVFWEGIYHPTQEVIAMLYEVCIGTTQLGCQVMPFTAAAGGHWLSDDLPLQCGTSYYATVRATNCAGLQRIVSSDGVKLCCEPPVAGGELALRDAAGKSVVATGAEVHLTLSWAFSDGCAGIDMFNVSITPLDGGAPLWHVLLNASHVSITIKASVIKGLPDGRYAVAVISRNLAGLTSIRSTDLVVDREPPVAQLLKARGSATDAWVHGRVCLPAETQHAEVQWDSFLDAASDVASYHIAVYTTGEDVQPPSATNWSDVGANRQLLLPVSRLRADHGGLIMSRGGVSLTYLRVRGCDSAGMCSVSGWSGPLVHMPHPPSGGHVQIASTSSRHISPGFAGPGKQLSVNASSFVAAGCPSICKPPNVQCVYDPTCTATPRRLGGRGCNAGGAGQNCRACGLGGAEPCPEYNVTLPSMVADLSHEVCIGTTQLGCQVMPFTAAAGGHWLSDDLPLQCGTSYYATVRATNCAGLQRIVSSDVVKLCCEPPVAGGELALREGISGMKVNFVSNLTSSVIAQWGGSIDQCSGVRSVIVALVEESDPPRQLWQMEYLADPGSAVLPMEQLDVLLDGAEVQVEVKIVNNIGLSAVLRTSFSIDRTPIREAILTFRRVGHSGPLWSGGPTCVLSSDNMFELGWLGMTDEQSGIHNSLIEVFAADVDGNFSRVTDIYVPRRTFATVPLNSANRTLRAGRRRIIVTACNPQGRCTTSSPLEFHVVSGPPEKGFVDRPGPGTGTEDFFLAQNASRMVNVAFQSFVSGEGAAPQMSYEVCVGTTPFACHLVPFTVAGDGIWHSSADLPLKCGTSYYATVRVTNCAGLQHTVSSAARKFCCEPPAVIGPLLLRDGVSGAPMAFASDLTSSVIAQWGGSIDQCSGVRSVIVALVEESDPPRQLWQMEYLADPGSAVLPMEQLDVLLDGAEVQVEVKIVNNIGLSAVLRTSFSIDLTPPSAGELFTGVIVRADVECSSTAQPLHLSWEGLVDDESGIQNCEWAIGTAYGGEQVKSFDRVDLSVSGKVPREWQNTTVPSYCATP